MSIKSVQRYQTSDGKLHDDKTSALKHEACSKVLTGVKTLIEKASISGFGCTHIDLVNKPELARAMRDQMNKVLEYHRNHTGKLAKRPTGRNVVKV